ncbi:MAG: homoaconitate hydratase [Chloroflexi bacterium HGW-Chloroflexi-10]|nr:MAG: homoaconitate hydratase [Chloroflexi bacterium HGW-Chloroflexi-10]
MARIWKFGTDVDTDQIVPGRYAPYMRPNEDVGNAAFIEANPAFNQQAVPGDIIVAGENFGCGSSREYAVLALKRRQVGAIIAKSFARIFYRNAVNLGLVLIDSPQVVDALGDGDQADLDLVNASLSVNGQFYSLPVLPPFARVIVEAGGVVAYIQKYGRLPGEPDLEV